MAKMGFEDKVKLSEELTARLMHELPDSIESADALEVLSMVVDAIDLVVDAGPDNFDVHRGLEGA